MGDRKLYRYYARLSGAVFGKVILCTLGFLGGRALDEKYGTAPYLMFLFFIVAVSAGLWAVIKVASRED